MESNDKKERGTRPLRKEEDWSELMKDATPEDVARALLRPARTSTSKKKQENGE